MYCTNGNATLPRDFRFHHEEGPKTPEPLSTDETRQPSPPRPRFKVRRRNASSLQAPTEQFLASVEAADVLIPTIEIPDSSDDTKMADQQEVEDTNLLAPQSHSYRFGSPPKTPIPQLSLNEACFPRPDWAMDSPDTFRPTSSQSNYSEDSDDSFYGSSRTSRPSENGSCTSPESEYGDTFEFPIISKGKGKAVPNIVNEAFGSPLNAQLRSKTKKDAVWTSAQSAHLWTTYNIYLQDATVTPFRFGGGSVPPEGVCHRVAREAKKSWKGPKSSAPKLARVDSYSSRASEKSGSATPTGDTPKTYAAWPHSSSATRSRLREMCKANSTNVSRNRFLQTRSPSPFTKPFDPFVEPRTPKHQIIINPWSTQDIALSLTTSTADSMRPDGPLAKLADPPRTPEPPKAPKTPEPPKTPTFFAFEPEQFKSMGMPKSRSLGNGLGFDGARERSLGSPFTAHRTYGPSSSKHLHPYDRPTATRSHSDNQGRLLSPVRFDSRSLNITQKRRAQHALEDELSPSGMIVRPSILDEQTFGSTFSQRRVRSRGFSLNDAGSRNRASEFSPPPVVEAPKIESPAPQPVPARSLLPSAMGPPIPRLGSPFSPFGSSNTFPRRIPSDRSTIRRSAFATMHQSRRSIESYDFGRSSQHPSRVEQLDERLGKALQQINEREAAANRRPSE